ncbi:type II secretion system F family protein [Acidiphilium sp. C61]|uniref:type II secretion system F family protein n=1 Tax=Acidiphilium sp. C61 TaxID=1671485 RepID=UPI00157A22A6|nr:type II secretion system F family protein [Acidiphilium sp. C61]
MSLMTHLRMRMTWGAAAVSGTKRKAGKGFWAELKRSFLIALFGRSSQLTMRRALRSNTVRPAVSTGWQGAINRAFFGSIARERFYEHLATSIENGRNDVAAIEIYRDRLKERRRGTIASIMGDLLRRLTSGGSSLSAALAVWVPAEEIRIIEGGEASGDMSKALNLVIEMNVRKRDLAHQIRSATLTPAFYAIVVYAFLLFVGIKVTPEFAKELPNPTGLGAYLYAEAAFCDSWQAFLPPFFMVAGTIAFKLSLTRWTGYGRAIVDDYPPFSIFRDIRGYVWLMTFSAMLQSGIADIQIIRQQLLSADPWLKERLNAARRVLSSEGGSLPMALAHAGVRGKRFNFPSVDMIDNMESIYGYSDSAERLAVATNRWAVKFDQVMRARVKRFGLVAEIALLSITAFVLIGMNAISQQMTMAASFH